MKKLGLCLLVIVLAAAAGFYFYTRSGADMSGPGAVVTSGYVPYTLAREISGGAVEVAMLLPPGAEPHGFEPSPGSMVAVHRAGAVVYVSERLEPWMKDVLGAAGKNTQVVALAAPSAATADPHVWMDFGQAVELARTLTAALVQLYPQHAELFKENLTRFERNVAVLDRDFARVLSSCETREVVHIGHLAFGALAKRYNLTLTALAGTSHDGEHSVRKLAGLVKHIRAAHVKALFTEEAVSPRLAQAVAAETGAEILPLYTVEHISKDDFNRAVTYEELMRRNLTSLQRGLACRK